MDGYVLPAFGKKPITEIKRPELQKFFNGLLRGMETSSARKVKIVLSGVMNLALADEKITVNPCPFVKLPPDEKPEKIALTFDQLGRVYVHAKPEIKVYLLISACGGGLRVGEVCGTSRLMLTSDNVLHVRQQILQLKGGAKPTKKLKTPATRRDIPYPAELADEIREQSGGRFYLCGTARNKFQLPNNITKNLKKACEDAKVPVITPHETRHTFISLMENVLRTPDAMVAAIVGKEDKRVTGGYSHAHETEIRKELSVYYSAFKKGQ